MSPQDDIQTDHANLTEIPEAPLIQPRAFRLISRLVLLAGFVAIPLAGSSFLTFQVTMVMTYAIAIIGLNLLTGFNGQFSLGHAAFYAIGAYTAAILITKLDVPYFWTIPAAALACFVVGFLFGLPALRLADVYLALATFALSVATPQLLKLSVLEQWTGGVQGIVIAKPDAPFNLPLDQDQWLYFVTLAVASIMYFCAMNLLVSRTGRAMMAIRDNPIAARSMGINASLYKAVTFGVSALYTGVAGALAAIAVQFVAPDSFTIALSIALLVGLVVGGIGWVPGSLIGGAFLVFVPNIVEQFSTDLSGAVYGVILMLLVFVMPSGAATLVQRLGRLTNMGHR